MNRIIRHTLGALTLLLLSPAAEAANIRDLRYEITDTAIVFPESTQTDVHLMQQNWYISNYTVLEHASESAGEQAPLTDEVLTARLQSMPTTIEMPFNQVVKSHIDLYVNRRRSLVETMLGMSLYYMPIFEEALEREGLPLELKYLPVIESALNPDAVSRAGATGLWQFMLPTAKGLGMEINTLVDERRDPIESSRMAARYLKQLYGIYHDWSLAIAAYNCGPGNINKALVRAGASAENPKDFWDIYYNLPAETRGYVPGFIGATYAMTHYAEHGISPSLAKRPILTDTVHVNRRLYFGPIASVLNIPVEELKVLNPQYRKEIIPGDVKPYPLRLPSQLVYTFLMLEDSITAESAKLAPRATVELGTSQTSADGNWKETTKWHKVRRGETLAQIARKYGVSQNEIKRWNKLKSSKLTRGKSLKIIVREAIEKPKEEEQPKEQQGQVDVIYEDPAQQQPADSTATACDEIVQPAEPEYTPEPEPEPEVKPAPKPAASKTHRVAKGDTLFALSKRYGVSVDRIKAANNMTDNNLRIGQRLTIPAK